VTVELQGCGTAAHHVLVADHEALGKRLPRLDEGEDYRIQIPGDEDPPGRLDAVMTPQSQAGLYDTSIPACDALILRSLRAHILSYCPLLRPPAPAS
jgi:hypothetical protein